MSSFNIGDEVTYPTYIGTWRVHSPVFENSFGDLCCDIIQNGKTKTALISQLTKVQPKEESTASMLLAMFELGDLLARYGLTKEQSVNFIGFAVKEPEELIKLIAAAADVKLEIK